MEDFDYNEEEAVKFIFDRLPAEMKKEIDNDDIEYILDCVYNFYDEKGYLDDEDDDEIVDISEEEIFDYVTDQILKDKKTDKFPEEVVNAILDGEYDYCQSLGVFEEDEE